MDFVWQQKGWPNATVARAALKDELAAFKDALSRARKLLRKPQDPEAVARALAQEAVETSAIEGVNVDESVVMSSICKVLGVAYAPKGWGFRLSFRFRPSSRATASPTTTRSTRRRVRWTCGGRRCHCRQ